MPRYLDQMNAKEKPARGEPRTGLLVLACRLWFLEEEPGSEHCRCAVFGGAVNRVYSPQLTSQPMRICLTGCHITLAVTLYSLSFSRWLQLVGTIRIGGCTAPVLARALT
jgi:hypothetical protein